MPSNDQNSKDIGSLIKDVAVMGKSIAYIEGSVKEIKDTLEGEYATKEWCQAQYGNATKLINIISIALATGLTGAVIAWIISGGLKIK